ncbi:MAG: PepB aminopeptidase, partial [Pseudoalteromonas distincta]
MSEKFVVQLSEQAAASHWGDNASLSFNERGATVHLSEQDTLKNVQKAGRTIAS